MADKSNQLFVDRIIVQFVLRAGLVAALVLMVLGLVVNFSQGATEILPVVLKDIFSSEIKLGNRFLGLGVVILALTPAARVATLCILWMREKDWKFVGVSLVVLATLIFSIAVAG